MLVAGHVDTWWQHLSSMHTFSHMGLKVDSSLKRGKIPFSHLRQQGLDQDGVSIPGSTMQLHDTS